MGGGSIPAVAERWMWDREFGRQFLQGAHPTAFRQLTRLPANFPVKDEDVQGVLGRGVTLQKEINVCFVHQSHLLLSWLSVDLSLFLFLCLSVHSFVHQSVLVLSVPHFHPWFLCLSVCLSVCPSVRLSVCPSVACLSVRLLLVCQSSVACLSFYLLLVCQSVCCLSVSLSVACLSVHPHLSVSPSSFVCPLLIGHLSRLVMFTLLTTKYWRVFPVRRNAVSHQQWLCFMSTHWAHFFQWLYSCTRIRDQVIQSGHQETRMLTGCVQSCFSSAQMHR